MKRFTDLEEFRTYLRSVWDECGECRSCGWHGLLSEHEPLDLPEDSDYERGYYWLPCMGDEGAEDGDHRGTRIPLLGAEKP